MEFLFHPIQDNIVLNQVHFIVSSYFNANESKRWIQKALKKFGYTSAILSRIYMDKEHCITKEKFDKMYKTNEESETRRDLSVGEDLETLIERIKNGKINKDTIPKNGDRKWTFLLCLPDEEERKKLERKDKDFMRTFTEHSLHGREPDVPEAEWKASESNMKFAKSYCYRRTYFIDASIIYSDSDSEWSSDSSSNSSSVSDSDESSPHERIDQKEH